MQLGNSSVPSGFTTKSADIGNTSSLTGIDSTYSGKSNENSPQPQEYQSNEQVTDSMNLDVYINSNSDYSNINEAVVGTANASSSLIIDWGKTTIEERTAFVNQFLKNVQEEYNLLENQYKTTYGKGIDTQKYSEESLNSILMLLNSGQIYNFLGIGTLIGMYNNDGNLDIEMFGQIVEKVQELGYIEKMQAYLNGASWEESGLSTIFTNREYGDPEQIFLFNISYSYPDIVGFYALDNQDIDTNTVKEKLKDYFNSNDTFNTYSNIQKDLIDAQTMQRDLQILGMNVYRIEQMAKLFPFEAVEENSDFSNYLKKDYTNYTRMKQENLHYLDQREVAIYDYLYDRNPSEAQEYLIALEDTINQRKGMEEAVKFINSIAENGGDVGDLFITGWEGLEDGTVNFVDGIIDFFTADGVINASEYEMMYKASILSSALQDSENFTEEFKKASKDYIENIPAWYRHVLSFNYSSWQSIGNMLIPSAVSFIPVVGKPIGLASMGISSAGNAAEGAMQNGESGAKAYLYGLGVGLSEAVLTNFIGGIPGLSNLSESFIKNAANEAYEEFIQTWIDTGLRAAIFQEPIDLGDTAFESLYSALQGFVVSGMMQGGQNIAFRIGNEIVYWSDSEFNSLSKLLQTKQFAHDMELAQELYNLYQEGTISESVYETLVSSEQRAQIESPNGEGTNNEGSNNDSIVNVDNNLANTIEALEEEPEEQITNIDEDNSEVASTEEIVDSNMYNQSEYANYTLNKISNEESVIITSASSIRIAETEIPISMRVSIDGITYLLNGSVIDGKVEGATKHIAEEIEKTYKTELQIDLDKAAEIIGDPVKIAKMMANPQLAKTMLQQALAAKYKADNTPKRAADIVSEIEKEYSKPIEVLNIKKITENLKMAGIDIEQLEKPLNEMTREEVIQLHAEAVLKIYINGLKRYQSREIYNSEVDPTVQLQGVPCWIDGSTDSQKSYYIEVISRTSDEGDSDMTIFHMVHKKGQVAIEQAVQQQGEKMVTDLFWIGKRAETSGFMNIINKIINLGQEVNNQDIIELLKEEAENKINNPQRGTYIVDDQLRKTAQKAIDDLIKKPEFLLIIEEISKLDIENLGKDGYNKAVKEILKKLN